jgi:hypothetical protein
MAMARLFQGLCAASTAYEAARMGDYRKPSIDRTILQHYPSFFPKVLTAF